MVECIKVDIMGLGFSEEEVLEIQNMIKSIVIKKLEEKADLKSGRIKILGPGWIGIAEI